ncbi:unnamed protein product [marine sediment metagenome]|uniref:Uncharacterized protein n=1 Tax=marine sediment metagenome TaxID=412755 RepID=X1LBN7_9ZZZZ
MKKTVTINKNTHLAYISDDIIKEGFEGEVEIIFNFNTGLMLRPGSNLKDQIKSAERILEDLRDRLKSQKKEEKQ